MPSARFLINGLEEFSIATEDTLLARLRRQAMTGTKEGCAEGDCGACTVVIGDLHDGVPRWQALNACILFTSMLHGKAVVTVEGLRGPNGQWHPCQQAMVDLHGSQCGFCTPGFVMSLYGLYLAGRRPDTATVNDALAGNLCRCTGYGPIIAAAQGMFDSSPPAWDTERRQRDVAWLRALLAEEPDYLVEFSGGDHPGRFYAPATLAQLGAVLSQAEPPVTFLGGATDAGLWVTKRLAHLGTTVHLGRVAELTRMVRSPDSVRIGGAVTYAEAMGSLAGCYPDLGELIRRLGSELVRNSGTIGGNIANGSPVGDMPPALIALGARLVLNGPEGQRRMPLEDFFLAYGKQDRKPREFVGAVEVPLAADGAELKCYKISKRFDQDISAVLGCFCLHLDNGTVATARIAFGGMAGIPKRAKAVEAMLTGKSWSMATVEAAFPAFERDFQPLDDLRASAAYRMTVAKNLLVRYFHETTSDVPTRLVGLAKGSDPFGLQ